MQGYSYSVFSIAAIVIHLIINFDLLRGRGIVTLRERRYRGFMLGILAYFLTDAAWGVLAGLGWTGAWYVDTMLFFLSMAVFAFMWCRFVITYLALGKWSGMLLSGLGYALLAANVAALSVNFFNNCVFYFDERGTYFCGGMRDPLFYLLIAYNALIGIFAFVKAVRSHDFARSRNVMIFLNCLTVTVAITLQVLFPLTPFTALGCLIGNCFLHVFVIRDEQTARHTAELENALDRAQAAEKARRLFFSIVSHDIRTPLNAILGYSELFQAGMLSESEKDEALKAIRASGTTLLQLVNDVLDLAKMDAETITLHPEPMRLAQLTDDVFASFRLTAAEKGIALVNRTAGVPTVILDVHRFRQILFNLIGNAVKFTARGSVTVAASYDCENLEVSVADTGCGISSEMQKNIFDPFFQVHDPSHSVCRDVGTGLGLTICRRLVDVMGGKLAVMSEPDKGSTFVVRIPSVAAGVMKTVSSRKSVDVKQILPAHVLVVDDSPVNQSVLRAFLKRVGIASIDIAGDGAEAFEKLDSAAKAGNPYDFVFSDFWMPNMNGVELVEKVRADPRFDGLPVYAVTADTELRRDPQVKLFTGFLLKPVTYDKLMEVFSSALS